MKIRWLTFVLAVTTVALVLGGSVSLAQPVEGIKSIAASAPAAPDAPPMSDFVEIQVDGQENLNPAVAYNTAHQEYLAVWEQHIHGGEVAIFGRRVGRDGRLKGPPFEVDHAPNQVFSVPDVAYSSAQDAYLVVYTHRVNANDYDIYAMPLAWNGSQHGRRAIDVDLDKDWYPAVAYNSRQNEFLVAYEKVIANDRRDIEAQRVRAADWSLASWRHIDGANNTLMRLPDVAYDAGSSDYLIAYTLNYPAGSQGDIVGKRTNHNMAWLGGRIPISPTGLPSQDGVALAEGPGEWLVVWYEDHGANRADIWGRRVGNDGSLSSFIGLAHGLNHMRVEPAVAGGDRGRYRAAWRYFPPGSPNWDIYGRAVWAGTNVLESGSYEIDIWGDQQKSPATACAPTGPCLVVYEDNFPGGVPYNIRGRLVGHHRAFLPMINRNQ